MLLQITGGIRCEFLCRIKQVWMCQVTTPASRLHVCTKMRRRGQVLSLQGSFLVHVRCQHAFRHPPTAALSG